ncbi:unnamed protein product [Ranitomeya imitator]|uniref:Uncharacterized protein n=1 Tax=Ranitomeya imitator TaxID=111125 RepID=A0ABN9KN86_9NEOB|nr:unnamed protein product [Ranitomeya imitator]
MSQLLLAITALCLIGFSIAGKGQQCAVPIAPQDGSVHFTEVTYQSVAHFSCDEGSACIVMFDIKNNYASNVLHGARTISESPLRHWIAPASFCLTSLQRHKQRRSSDRLVVYIAAASLCVTVPY